MTENDQLPLVAKSVPKNRTYNILYTITVIFTLIVIVLLSATAVFLYFYFKPSCENCIPTTSLNGAVSADHPLCSEIGTDILKQGGNAVDASVAVALCLGVMNPMSSGLGGGSVMMIWFNNKVEMLDCREAAPLNASRDMFKSDPIKAQRGGLSIAVPGELKCLHLAWQKYGNLSWHKLVEPSIELAKEHKVYKQLSRELAEYESMIKEYPNMWSVYAPNGKVLQEGDVLKNPALAATLEQIAKEGADALYKGPIAEKLVADIQEAGGIITMKDLEVYEALSVEPIQSEYRGYKIYTANPSFSGPCLQMALNILSNFDLPKIGYDSHLSSHWMIEALKYAFAYRTKLGDPRYVNITKILSLMLDESHAKELAQKLSDKQTFEPKFYAPPGNFTLSFPGQDSGTSHFNVVDKDRNAVAYTTTVNLIFGSMVHSPSTGILLNDGMDDFSIPNVTNAFGLPPSKENFIAPGKRSLSSMIPTIVTKDNKVHLVVGASGGPKIITGTLEVLLNTIDFGMNVGDAISKPRFHHQLYPQILKLEEGYPKDLANKHKERGHEIVFLEYAKEFSAATQAIQVLDDGRIQSKSDWRKYGKESGY